MRPAAVLAAFLLAAAPGFAQGTLPEGMERPLTVEDLPPGYPPKMGDITGMMGGKPVAWETYDFSVGAFDGSAQARQDWTTHEVSLNLIGYPPGKPDARRMRIRVDGSFGKALRPGAATEVTVSVSRGEDFDGPRLTSEGQSAEMVIDSIGPKVSDSYSRRVIGHVAGRICPKDWLFKACQDISMRFDTDVQIDGDFPIRR